MWPFVTYQPPGQGLIPSILCQLIVTVRGPIINYLTHGTFYATHPCRVWRNPVVVRSIELFFSKMLNIRDLNLGITVNCVRSGIGGSAHDLVEKRENRHLSVAAAPPVAAFQFCNLSRSHAPRCGRRRRCN